LATDPSPAPAAHNPLEKDQRRGKSHAAMLMVPRNVRGGAAAGRGRGRGAGHPGIGFDTAADSTAPTGGAAAADAPAAKKNADFRAMFLKK